MRIIPNSSRSPTAHHIWRGLARLSSFPPFICHYFHCTLTAKRDQGVSVSEQGCLSCSVTLPFSPSVSGLSGRRVVLVSDIGKTLRYVRVHVNPMQGADVVAAPHSGLAARTGNTRGLSLHFGFAFFGLMFYFEVFPDCTSSL